MSIIISFANRKGGVGKTTSTLNIGAALALRGKKVLCIDLDPQANLTQALLKKPPKNTIFTLLMQECTLPEALCTPQENLLLIPANNTFARFEKQFAGEADAQYVLADFIAALQKTAPEIAYILLDCPPALGLITLNAFVASHTVYVPMEAQQFSLEGLNQVQAEIQKIKKRHNTQLQLGGIFFCRHNPRTYISRDILGVLAKNYPGLLMQSFIRRSVALEESPSAAQSIFGYAPKSKGAKDYDQLVDEILEHVEKKA